MIPELHPAKNFTPDLTKGETILGWVYLVFHVLVLPFLLALVFTLRPSGLPSDSVIEAVYMGVGVVFTALFFRRLLRREFDHLCDNLSGSVMSFVLAYFLWYLLAMALQLLLTQFGMETDANPNDEAIGDLAQQAMGPIMMSGVILAPILEEVLFRGVVFQSIRKKSRVLAYVVSITLFSLYHVWQYALFEMDLRILLYALQYIPITLALTWAYERSGSLWTSIFFHMLNNGLSLLLMAAGN